MKVSIITATFNSQSTIEKCINSIRSQTYKNIEHVVIDGNSSDKTVDIITPYINNSDYFISESDDGIFDALNKGLKAASGDIIGYLHSDDEFFSNETVEKIVNEFKTGVCGVYGNLIYVKRNKKHTPLRYWKSNNFKPIMLKYGWMPPHPTLFLSSEVYKEIGQYDLNFKISSDYDFMIRVFSKKKFKIKYLNKVITKMLVGGTSNRNIYNIVKKSIEDFHIIRKNNVGGFWTLLFKNVRKINQFFIPTNNFFDNQEAKRTF